MPDEYISREKTLALLKSLGSRDYRREKGTIQDAIKMISSSAYTPAADVAQVVRCKDCKHRTEAGNCGHPRHHGILPSAYPYDFAAMGNGRKETTTMFQIELLSGGVFWVYAVYPQNSAFLIWKDDCR